MTIIFVHLYFLIIFEIFFYLYYIMPYEKALIYNLFDISDYTDIKNKSVLIYYIEDQLNCRKSQKRIDDFNDKLWVQCMAFVGILNAILFVIIIRDIVLVRKQYQTAFCTMSPHNSRTTLVESDYKKNDDVDIEMGPALGSEIVTEVRPGLGQETFILYYWKNSKFVKNTGKTVRFIILVGIFEYAFFTLIINKYKIVNTTTLLCKMVHES
jgi:hypothetical protein